MPVHNKSWMFEDKADKIKRKLLFGKKGQFYIITAIILLVFAAGIASSGSNVIKPKNTLQELKKEFVQESPIVINLAILQKNLTTNVTGRYDEFVNNFITYSKTKNAKLDIAYLLAYDNSITVGNYYNNQITANQNGITTIIQSNQVVTLSRTSSINITAGDYVYDFEIENGATTHGIIRKDIEIVLY